MVAVQVLTQESSCLAHRAKSTETQKKKIMYALLTHYAPVRKSPNPKPPWLAAVDTFIHNGASSLALSLSKSLGTYSN